jgi:hypothetical protein
MPFLRYRLSTGDSGATIFTRVRNVQLAGSSGPIAKHVKSVADPSKANCEWHLSAQKILTLIGIDPAKNAILIDITPRDKQCVSMMRLEDIWGYSYAGWTPLLLQLQTLYVSFESERPDSNDFKKEFDDHGIENKRVYEFLYMQGGTKQGTWNWGLVGRVNGALLWPDALQYFIGLLPKEGVPR